MKKIKIKAFTFFSLSMMMLFSSCGVEDKAEDALPRLEVSTARLDLTREGTTTTGDVPTLTIRANQGYSMTVDQPWVTVDKPSGKGFQIVTLTVEPNEGDASREAVITVTNNYITEHVRLYQSNQKASGNRTFYEEHFDWAIPFGKDDPVAMNKGTSNRTSITDPAVAPLWAATGLKSWNTEKTSSISIYLHYIHFNSNGNFDTGVVLPKMAVAGKPANVVVSFVMCNDAAAGDRVPVVLEIQEGAGTVDGGKISKPLVEGPGHSTGVYAWREMSFEVTGITSETVMSIHTVAGTSGTWDPAQPNKYCRWFLDDIIVKEKPE